MKRCNKKGFTIVELVIVIAVIAILAAVLIPTVAGLVKKANVAKDTQLIRNLNTALAADTDDAEGVRGALAAAEKFGYNVAKINASAVGNEILWDSVNDVFCYYNADKAAVEYIPEFPGAKSVNDIEYWAFSSTPSAKYSTYLHGYQGSSVEVSTSLDVGNCIITDVTYASDKTQNVTIRTFGNNSTLTIDAPNSNVDFYGFANAIVVDEVASASLHIYGSVSNLSVAKGHVVVENTGVVSNVAALDATDSSIDNKGYIKAAASDEIAAAVTGKAVGGDYEISSLAQLEALRDAVNNGNTFSGITVKLMSDITLNDGWRPIGEGARKQPAENDIDHSAFLGTFTGYAFGGTFNGNGKTISNLNNKGFVPATNRITEGMYTYGLFGIVSSGAVIKDLTLANVDIDTTRYSDALGECVGALVGLASGKVDISGVKVSGSIKAYDSVGGIIGGARNQDTADCAKSVSVANCENSASIVATNGKAAGIFGYAGLNNQKSDYPVSIIGNKNSGKVESLGVSGSVAGIILFDGRAFQGEGSAAKNNVNTGDLYLNAEAFLPAEAGTTGRATHGYGMIGSSVSGNMTTNPNILDNTNSGKFYVVSASGNEEKDFVRIFAHKAIPGALKEGNTFDYLTYVSEKNVMTAE